MRFPCCLSLVAIALIPAPIVSGADVLLIPDSGNDRIWAFRPTDGALISNNFIPTNAAMPQAICAIDSGRGTILVTVETTDTIQEFSTDGTYIGVFADSTDGIDGPFGITRFNNQIYVASSVNGRIVRFDLNGSNPTHWATAVGTPRDIGFRASDALVTESANDDIARYNLDGTFNSIWHNSDGVSGIDFPQQLQIEEETGGGFGAIVAGFTAPFGLYRFGSSGAQTGAFTNLITSPRGVFVLDNGDILYAGGTRVRIYDPESLTELDVVNDLSASFRFIERVAISSPCGSADFDGDGDTGTDLDIEACFACLGGNCCAPCGSPDFDGDGDTGTDLDIEAFFRVLGGGNC